MYEIALVSSEISNIAVTVEEMDVASRDVFLFLIIMTYFQTLA